MMRRQTALTAIVVAGIGGLLIWYVVYTQRVREALQAEARRTSQISAMLFSAFSDTSAVAADLAIMDVLQMIRASGVPTILTDKTNQEVIDHYNLPTDREGDMDKVRALIPRLDAENPPIHIPQQII